MRLIDANVLFKSIRDYTFDTVDNEMRRAEHIVKAHICSLIESQKTSYDVNKVLKQLEEKRDFCYSEMEKERNETDYFSEHIFEEYHNQGKAFNEALEIVKGGGINAED